MNTLSKSLLIGAAVAAIIFIAATGNTKTVSKKYDCTYRLLVAEDSANRSSYAATKDVLVQRLRATGWKFEMNETGNNELGVRISGADDTLVANSLLTGPGKIQFREVYLPVELLPLLENANRVVNNVTKPLAEITHQIEKKDSPIAKLGDRLTGGGNEIKPAERILLEFSPIDPSLKYSMIGTVNETDTSEVRKLFQGEELRKYRPANAQFFYGRPEKAKAGEERKQAIPLYCINTRGNHAKASLENEDIKYAALEYNQFGDPQILLEFKAAGTRKWANMTQVNIDRPIAIILDGLVISAPNVNSAIENGVSAISGGFTIEECQVISKQLMTPPLPTTVTLVSSGIQNTTDKNRGTGKLVIPILGFLVAGGLSFFAIKALKFTKNRTGKTG